jgi:hypothetical protein
MKKVVVISGVKYVVCPCPDCSPRKVKRVVADLVKREMSKRARRGGLARKRVLSPERRREIARLANAAKRRPS